MSGLDLSDLQRFRADVVAQGADLPPVPGQPTGKRFRVGRVLAFDQALGNTGVVVLTQFDGYPLKIDRVEVVTAPRGLNLRSNLDVLTAGEHLYDEVSQIIAWCSPSPAFPFAVAIETPPNAVKVKGAGTSSLVAAMAIRAACKAHNVGSVVIARPTWGKFVGGSATMDKKEVHAHLTDFHIEGRWPTNEHQRDALCIALTALREQ